MGLISRVGQGMSAALTGAGDALQRLGNAFKVQHAAPSVNIPGVNKWALGQPANMNEQMARALGSVDALMGRVSYDAGPSFTRFSSFPATDLTPEKIAGAQQEALAGYPLRWAEMIEQVLGRDSHLSGIAQQRVDDVLKGSWKLMRSAADDVAACVRNFVQEAMQDTAELEDGFGWLLWSNSYAYNAIEITWTQRWMTFPGPNGEILGPIEVIVPMRVDPVHAKHFRFDLRTDEPLLWLGSDTVRLPFGKFVFMKGEGEAPITERRGFMWPCIWLSMFRSLSWAGWANYVERYGLPTPLIEYDGTVEQYREHADLYRLILRDLGKGYGAIVPSKGLKIGVVEQPEGGKASDPHSALSDACDAAQSIRVLGATMTTKIGNVGSFAASSNHMEVKYAKEEKDARRLWATLRTQMMAPIVLFNARAIAVALNKGGYRATPDMILRRVPKGMYRVPREVDPVQRGELVTKAINQWGLKLGAEGLMDEFAFPQPINNDDIAPGAPTPVSSGGKLRGAVEAANEGVDAPQEQQAGKGAGGQGSAPPKGLAAPVELSQELADAVAVLTEEDDQAERFDHATQPRDAKGRFAAVAGAKSAVAQNIAKHLTEQGHGARVEGSTVYLKNGSKIEVGNKGDRSYHGSAAAKVQTSVEGHLSTHNEKHVRDWAAKTQPAPAARPARVISPEKQAARDKARAERQHTKDQARAEKQEARAAKKTERAAVKAERTRAIAERKATREAAREEKIGALKAIGAPVTPDGKIDASRVPGASATFSPPTSADPENSFRGRSYYARSAEEMKQEFLGATGRGGRNEDLLSDQVGGTTKQKGGVRDAAQWDAVRLKYEAPHVETFDEAFKVLAQAAAKKNPLRKPDWRDFDLETLRECNGLQHLDVPAWLHEAANEREQHEQMAAYYGDRHGGDDEEHEYRGGAYHPAGQEEEVPF
jgi:hypothetical protein